MNNKFKINEFFEIQLGLMPPVQVIVDHVFTIEDKIMYELSVYGTPDTLIVLEESKLIEVMMVDKL